jgi:hypothetical protein
MRCSLCSWSLIGPASCRGNLTIRSHSRQHRSANGPIGMNRSAAFCHSIAAVNGNPFFSSRCAARQYLRARGAVPASASSLRTFPAGLPLPPLTNLTAGFTPFTSWVVGRPYDLACKRRCMDNRTQEDLFPYSLSLNTKLVPTKEQAANQHTTRRSQAGNGGEREYLRKFYEAVAQIREIGECNRMRRAAQSLSLGPQQRLHLI